MKNEEKPAAPVTIHYDEQGNPDGIRICALDEDFILKLHDEPCGYVNYAKAKKYSLPSRKMINVYAYYINEVKKLMVEAGGEPLVGLYWTETPAEELFGAYGVNCQLIYYGTTGALTVNPTRIGTTQVRVALALK